MYLDDNANLKFFEADSINRCFKCGDLINSGTFCFRLSNPISNCSVFCHGHHLEKLVSIFKLSLESNISANSFDSSISKYCPFCEEEVCSDNFFDFGCSSSCFVRVHSSCISSFLSSIKKLENKKEAIVSEKLVE